MADGASRFQQGAIHPLLAQLSAHNPPHRQQNRPFEPSLPSSLEYIDDHLTSPTRSPPIHSPPQHSFAMFGGNHQQGHNVFMNGAHGQSRFGMPLAKPFQGGSQHHQGHGHRPQSDHLNHNNFVSHQHNSSGGFHNPASQFNSGQIGNRNTPSHLHNGLSRPHNEHWTYQLQCAQQSREASDRHHWAKNTNLTKGASTGAPSDTSRRDTISDNDGQSRSKQNQDVSASQWDTLDISGLGLRALAPPMFAYPFLRKLYLNNNKLAFLPPEIGRLKNLTHLDLSGNELTDLPAEIGMLINLRELWLFYNQLDTLPTELGSLYQLEMLGVEGNPLHEELRSLMVEEGTRQMICTLRESSPGPPAPMDRETYKIKELRPNAAGQEPETFSVMSYNTLCDKMAGQNTYPYASKHVLSWDNRRQTILDEVRHRSADIICLQEVDTESYYQFFKGELARDDYRGHFWPRSRARTMTDKEAKSVDGCATFVRNSKYTILDRQQIDFAHIAINRADMKHTADVFNRVMPRDHIAVVMFIENRETGDRLIVVNVHLFWDHLYRDVKVVQTAILVEQLTRIAESYAKRPACTAAEKSTFRFATEDADVDAAPSADANEYQPSQEYPNGQAIPLVICGDFNSLPDSGVHELLNSGALAPDHVDFNGHAYGNFTRDGITHPFQLKSAYGSVDELSFTNYTSGFQGVIDYIWYSTNALQVAELLGDVDHEYMQRVPGFPNAHFPSDHLALMATFAFRQRKDRQKAIEGENKREKSGGGHAEGVE